MRAHWFLLIVFAGLPVAACAKSEKETRQESKPQEVAAAHASAGVKPGTHEDWCGEHGVPESQCTLCNPSLAAAFKATNDWCAEHGLPESHCRKCNPNLTITRPPKPN